MKWMFELFLYYGGTNGLSGELRAFLMGGTGLNGGQGSIGRSPIVGNHIIV